MDPTNPAKDDDLVYDKLREEPLTREEKFFLAALIVISGLTGIGIWKGVGWLVLWIKEVLKCF